MRRVLRSVYDAASCIKGLRCSLASFSYTLNRTRFSILASEDIQRIYFVKHVIKKLSYNVPQKWELQK
uniref:Uncharacterized protein n=1 Tax=Candidatus Kentrum sp. TUN TaxID=2126343 RepID=A0A450ZLU5_9GAMM|nr:MAG: hypothetical protein BECKTUN1418F_GA0071002_10562 [Candidatus Kentron sp. TUN]VFK55329.1 MAG: hypothetical protein BECKTUN1418D_GA0071000_10314 [Candidatus Kentron sp. TUN]VFK60407.1 MAG: hypothetical protein BECKTUN1418E_GA0071001_10581 [Candidatus Kentron sp. TUN]